MTTDGMWRPNVVRGARHAATMNLSYGDGIAHAKRCRVLRKWSLFQARRRGECRGTLGLIERDVAYYDWRIQFLEAKRDAGVTP